MKVSILKIIIFSFVIFCLFVFWQGLKKNNNFHPGLKTEIPQEIKIFKFEKFDELLNSNVDLIVLGISSKGIEWVSDQLSRLYKKTKTKLILKQNMSSKPNRLIYI